MLPPERKEAAPTRKQSREKGPGAAPPTVGQEGLKADCPAAEDFLEARPWVSTLHSPLARGGGAKPGGGY